ncbi:MAG: Uma2 family endonuclease [Cyanobacteria bacterium J06648_1]
MFTDRLNIPIDRDRARLADQILSLAEICWDDYEELTKTEEYSGYRTSYWYGVLTIVSPSRNHERIAEIINGLIKAFCRHQNLAYFPLGSTTLKKPPLAGKEPDHSFAFGTDKSFPDLAVEVTYTSGETHSPYRGKVASQRWGVSPVRRKTQTKAHGSPHVTLTKRAVVVPI